MKIIKPARLRKGDIIGLITPASRPDDMTRIDKGVTYLEKLGYRVEIGANVGKQRGYLAGTDEERLSDFHAMFENKNVKGIFCIRGGYGSGRLLSRINFNLIKKNPKIFIGYSDITALQLAIFKKTGLITFAGPMVAPDFGGDISEFSEENLWRVLTVKKKVGRLCNPNGEKFYILNKGRESGTILGGNLALLISLFGTEYLPNLKNSILLLEDIGEKPYRIDRMFNQLKLAKVFSQVKGVILGRFVDCYENNSGAESLTLNEVVTDYLLGLKIPVIYNFKHGHIKDNLTIPFGLHCKLNSSRGFVDITESAVT